MKNGGNSIGCFPINPEKHLDSHWTSMGSMPNCESITEAKGIGYVNGQAGGSCDHHGW